MLKPNKNLTKLLTATVIAVHLQDVIKDITDFVLSETAGFWVIEDYQSRFGKAIKFSISLDDFEVVEDLKPYKWYPPEKWDGNPNGWLLLEQNLDGIYQTIDFTPRVLFDNTARFMYIETNEVKGE